MSIFGTGISGLQAAQIGMLTTEHNIANATTAGFNRQRIIQASNIAMLTGSGFIGQGTNVSTIERMYDSFLSSQVTSAQTASSELDTYYTELKKIDNMLADAEAGVSPALQDFFAGVQDVSASPSLVSSRQAMISAAQALVARYQGIDERLSQMDDGINSRITSTVGLINSYSTQIANLNENIVMAESSVRQPANDLRDQRDQLVLELNKLVKVTTTTNTDGSFNVYIGNGQQLVVGTQVLTLTALPSSADPSRIVVGMQTPGGSQEMPESLITGGALGGLVKFRSELLDRIHSDLGRNAASLALTFNAQNALGQDLLGQSSGAGSFVSGLFTISSPTVIASRNNSLTSAVISARLVPPSFDGSYTLERDAAAVAPFGFTLTRQSDGQVWTGSGATTAAALAALQGSLPTSEGLDLGAAALAAGESTQVFGAAANGANFYTRLTASDYQLRYDGTNYSMTRLADNTKWSDTSLDALSATIAGSEGFAFELAAGAIGAGDSFIIQPTRSAAKNLAVNATVAADVRLVAAAMPMRTTAAMSNTGSGKISAGTTLPGFDSSALDTAITFTYDSATKKLTLSSVPNGQNISVSSGTTSKVYSGLTIDYTPGATISFAGMSVTINGSLNDGDRFTVARNSAGVTDGRNSSVLGQLQSKNTMSGQRASFQSAYAQLVSDAGNKSREIAVKGEAQASLLEQAESARNSLSGVNLDEEATNLLRYQQAYQAAAKILQIGNQLFDDLLAIVS